MIITVPATATTITSTLLLDWQKSWLADDISHSEFLSTIIFSLVGSPALPIDADATSVLHDWGSPNYLFHRFNTRTLSGPVLFLHGRLSRVYRLYTDYANSFVAALRPTNGLKEHAFTPVSVAHTANPELGIAVESRLLAQTSSSVPLSGLRMTVKDMFDIQGHRTGLGSRAFLALSKPSRRTAPAVQMLLDAGALLVGMTQLCAMVGKQEPTQSVDFPAPFNPRGDGFQSPSGGSSGQPSAIASYDWLDFAVGSDSSISGRVPAQANGCFSYRPSLGLASAEGMWSGVPRFDTPCIFARELVTIQKVIRVWGGKKPLLSGWKPTDIYVPTDFLPVTNEGQMKIFDSFVKDISTALNIPVHRFSIEDTWSGKPPSRANGVSLRSFLDPSVATRSYVVSIWQRISQFCKEYEHSFGATPFLPLPKGIHTWDDARDVTPEQSKEAWAKLDIYKDWFLSRVMTQGDRSSLVLMPLTEVRPCYRDEWPLPPTQHQQLWESLLLSPVLSAPEIVVPAGQLSYNSRISGRMEQLPVCVSAMAPPGMDLSLVELMSECLRLCNRPQHVMTGKTMFPIH